MRWSTSAYPESCSLTNCKTCKLVKQDVRLTYWKKNLWNPSCWQYCNLLIYSERMWALQWDGPSPRRYLFTGHTNGRIQVWDMTTTMDTVNKSEEKDVGGLTEDWLTRLDRCDLCTSHCATPKISLATSVVQHSHLWISDSSLQLQYHETIHEAVAYGSMRPYQRKSLVSKSKEDWELSQLQGFPDCKLQQKYRKYCP